MSIKDKPLESIGLSNRSVNALKRADLKTAGDLLALDEGKLYGIRNLGKKSIDEILSKIEELKTKQKADDGPGSFLSDLSVKAYNLLMTNNITDPDRISSMTMDDLLRIPFMDSATAAEIIKKAGILQESRVKNDIAGLMEDTEYHAVITEYVKLADLELDKMRLSVRSLNCLTRCGYKRLSDIIFLSNPDLLSIKNMGAKSAEEISGKIREYLDKHEKRIIDYCNGNKVSFLDEKGLRDRILDLYKDRPFSGFSLDEMLTELDVPKQLDMGIVKHVIGSLLAEGELEYVDYRCYRIYKKFSDYLKVCESVNDLDKEYLARRLSGETLESIGQSVNTTRERIRQRVSRALKKTRQEYLEKTGLEYFDEDYYSYLYKTYAFDRKDAGEWLGIQPYIWKYFDMTDVKGGTKPLEEAASDLKIDVGLRIRIRNYLNKDKLLIDGQWVKKERAALEAVVARKFCQDTVTFERFAELYNNYLSKLGIPYSEDLYYTDSVQRTRKNRFQNSVDFVLWKMNERLRYYDIKGRDYTELFEELSLDSYSSIMISTAKLMREHSDIMEKYDIRDQYELHNLLKKIEAPNKYNFEAKRMPDILFGEFDMQEAFLEILKERSRISASELVDIINREYGFEKNVIASTYLQCLNVYYHQGFYTIDQKPMSSQNMVVLREALTDDLYYFDEIRTKYKELFPAADPDEINPRNLKLMGFTVFSKYALQHYPSLDAYFRELLTKDEVSDIHALRKRFTYCSLFSNILNELKKTREVVEYDRNKLISIKRLESTGVGRNDLQRFCDMVYDWVAEDELFTMRAIINKGFDHSLFELGFSDWFYAALVATDNRFSYGYMFSNIVLCKGEQSITIKNMLVRIIDEYGSIDIFDLINELEDRYGCTVSDKYDLIYKVSDSDVYYDSILERFYRNHDLYDKELDAAEGQ